MNDDFLTRFRKPPGREFSAALYERINNPMNTQNKFTLRRFTFAAALCLALAAAFLFSPSARAALEYIYRQIGEITFLEEQGPSTPVPESQITIVPDDVMSLAEAQERLPFEISLPTWAPEGFHLGSVVRVTYFGDRLTPVDISYYSDNPASAVIILTVSQPVQWEVDLDHLQEVQVNGEPAGLTRGNWDADTGQWTGSDTTLTWLRGDVMYRLSAPGVPAEDLIRMAESIP